MRNKNIKSDGFTIIEVLIVLAIAGLIMLIVFLAVPALQRNSRNTQRKNDVNGLSSAITEFVNNNNGQPPAAASDFTGNWKPGYYTASSVTFTANTTPTATSDPADVNKINVGLYSTCSGTSSTATGATPRSVAVVYDVEDGGGNKVKQCVTAQ
jgi:prepilin-type N-terminal cleavage/methylation domain-containing protein